MVDDAIIRQWARDNGYSVGERGRLSKNIETRFYAEHPEYDIPADIECPTCYRAGEHRDWCTRGKVAEVAPVAVAEFVTAVPEEDDVVAPLPVLPAETAPDGTEASLVALIRGIAATAVTDGAAPLDEARVIELAREEALSVATEVFDSVAAPKVYEIHIGDRPVLTLDKATHAQFETVVKIVGAGLHVYLVGPPGTGKTTLCSQVAEALGLPFGMIPCDPTMPASKLFGFIDAGGNYRDTVFRRCYEDGGVYLFDELDNAHPGIIASINGAIANGHCAFPDGMVKRSADFRCIAAANTFGTGATRQFVGRNQLDAATLDRFVTVVVDIDEALEEVLTVAAFPADVTRAKLWLGKVREWRKNAADKNLQVIISPRASTEGAKLLSIGFDMATAAEMKVWKGMDKGTRDKIEGSL